MRQLVPDYLADHPGQEALRAAYGERPVLSVLIRAYSYLVARYDIDGFRIDTAKYVAPRTAELFGNAVREFALSAGKANFFTFGEVASAEDVIDRYVGRQSSEVD